MVKHREYQFFIRESRTTKYISIAESNDGCAANVGSEIYIHYSSGDVQTVIDALENVLVRSTSIGNERNLMWGKHTKELRSRHIFTGNKKYFINLLKATGYSHEVTEHGDGLFIKLVEKNLITGTRHKIFLPLDDIHDFVQCLRKGLHSESIEQISEPYATFSSKLVADRKYNFFLDGNSYGSYIKIMELCGEAQNTIECEEIYIVTTYVQSLISEIEDAHKAGQIKGASSSENLQSVPGESNENGPKRHTHSVKNYYQK